MAGSKYESDLKRVFRAIRDGCSQAELTRRTQWLKRRERSEILADLEASGAIQQFEEKRKRDPRPCIDARGQPCEVSRLTLEES